MQARGSGAAAEFVGRFAGRAKVGLLEPGLPRAEVRRSVAGLGRDPRLDLLVENVEGERALRMGLCQDIGQSAIGVGEAPE